MLLNISVFTKYTLSTAARNRKQMLTHCNCHIPWIVWFGFFRALHYGNVLRRCILCYVAPMLFHAARLECCEFLACTDALLAMSSIFHTDIRHSKNTCWNLCLSHIRYAQTANPGAKDTTVTMLFFLLQTTSLRQYENITICSFVVIFVCEISGLDN